MTTHDPPWPPTSASDSTAERTPRPDDDPASSDAFVAYNNALFRRVAPCYWVLDRIVARLRPRFVDYVQAAPRSRILDLATGTGMQARAFADAGHLVVGADLSPDMLAVAARRHGHPRLQLAQLDGTRLPFEDAEFDVGVMSFALHCMPPAVRAAAVRELQRVTRRSGRVAFVDYNRPEPAWQRRLVCGLVGLYETPLYREFIDSDFAGLLAGCGLAIERRRTLWGGAIQMVVCSHTGSDRHAAR